MKLDFKHMIMNEEPAPEGGGGGDVLDGKAPPVEAAPEHTGTVEEGWLAGVDRQWAEDSSLQNIKDLPSLVKSYVNAQKLIGKDKIVLPSEHATNEERREFLHKLGLPRDIDEYGVQHSEESRLSEDFTKQFVEKAYEQGVMPQQAKEMLSWYENQMVSMEQAETEAYAQEVKETIENLQTKYGQAYESKINLANTILSEIASEEQIQDMRDTGLLSNQNFIETMVTLGEKLVSEGRFSHDPKADGRLTPTEAQEQINMVMADMGHPYHNKAHPNHKNAIKEMERLFQMVV